MLWYLLQIKSKQERKVVSHLEDKELSYFCPEFTRNTRNGNVIELMFPGYVFVELDKETGPFHKVKHVPGVINFISFSDYPLGIRPEVIEAIKERVDYFNKQSNDEYFAKGDLVRITDGPFKEFNALFKYKSGLDRVIVLMSICGRMTSVEVKPGDIEKVDDLHRRRL